MSVRIVRSIRIVRSVQVRSDRSWSAFAPDFALGRTVAIKVLPEALAVDPDRVARFEREAKVLASLNHAHIATIYGVEDATVAGHQVHALVMELVRGADAC